MHLSGSFKNLTSWEHFLCRWFFCCCLGWWKVHPIIEEATVDWLWWLLSLYFHPWNHLILSDSQEFNLGTSLMIQYDEINNFDDNWRSLDSKKNFLAPAWLKTFLEQFKREPCEQDEIVDLDQGRRKPVSMKTCWDWKRLMDFDDF